MVLNQPFPGKRPEPFNPVDVDLSLLELIAMVDIEMLVATEHERILSPPLVCVYDGASPHPLHRLGHKTLGRDILSNTHRDPPSPFQDPVDNGLASCTSSTLSFPLPSEVGFICFQFSLQNIVCLGKFLYDNPAKDIIGSQCGFVAQVDLLGGLPG